MPSSTKPTLAPPLLFAIDATAPNTSPARMRTTGRMSASSRSRKRMITHIVATPERHAHPSPKGRSASCSAAARTVAPSQTAARMKKATASTTHSTIRKTIRPTCSLTHVVTCCCICAVLGVPVLPPVPWLKLELNPAPPSPENNAISHRYLCLQAIRNERVTLSQYCMARTWPGRQPACGCRRQEVCRPRGTRPRT